VPTVIVWSSVQEAPSDDALVTFDPASGPALAIGRLPMSTSADMQSAVEKIVYRRLASRDDGLLLVRDSDDNPPPFPFSMASADVRAALSGWKEQALVRGPDLTANGAALMDALHAGPVAVDYQGHGSEDHWGGGFLSTADTDKLAGTGGTALVTAATCLNAYFIDPDRESLGAALLRTPAGGAWGVWANSAFSVPTEHALFSKTVLSAVLNDGLTLGEATLKAKQALTDSNVRSTFHLLGDPSARAVASRSSALTVGSPKSGASGCSTSGGPLAVLAPLVLGLLALSRRRRRPT
jgi:MYXO-CTERM domain-containing protein